MTHDFLDFKVWVKFDENTGLMTTGLPLGGWDKWWVNLHPEISNNSLYGEYTVGKNIEVLQFTGILDSKGNKIYDYDILKCTSKNIFSEGEISYKQVIRGYGKWHIKGTYFDITELQDYCIYEVIGSYFTHKHLIS